MNEKEIKTEIKELIDRYKKIDRNTSEANILGNLIDPLFALLGWDITDTKEYDRNSYVRGAGFADVGLLIEGKPVIFLEAKKIGKIPKNRIDPQAQTILSFKELQHLIDRTPEEKQAMRYARGKEIPWAILTNFECLFVFNADHERIILSFKSPEEYLTRFDKLWRLSKERVKAKSLEWVQDQLKKEEIDKSFLEKLENWRLRLAQNIYNNNKDNHILADEKGHFDFEKLMHIVQRILSRLLVISIADDKEVLETQNILETLYKSYEDLGKYAREDYLLTRFIELSHSMDEQHNTTIFAPGHPCEKVKILNEVFASILKELCNFSFRKMSVDILGATYESYLGYRFAIKNGKINAEVDPRVRKQSGIYYTPTYIVHYIVDNTLGKMLKEIEKKHDIRAIEEIKDIKVLDPACGSGSFLIYAFDVLADFYDKQNEKITKMQFELSKGHANPTIFEQLENFKNLPKQVRNYPKKILEDHLYGVDLDPAAAEIATINLVIKAFEKMKRKKLPLILNQNIKVGNSLISGVREKEDLKEFKKEIAEHIALRKKLKETEDEKEKEKIMDQIDDLRQKANSRLNESLKEYFKNPEDKRPFNWEFEFPEVFDQNKSENEKGFDAVIGNPPWIQSKKMSAEDKAYYEENFFSVKKQYDIFNALVEQGVNLLKEDRLISYITPSRFLMNPDYEKFREFIVKRTRINQIVDIGEHIFKNVEMPALIFVLTKHSVEDHCKENIVLVRSNILNLPKRVWSEYNVKQDRFFAEDKYLLSIYLPEDKRIQDVILKMDKNALPLRKFVDNARGVEIGKKSKLIFDRRIDKRYVPFLVGEDIDRYEIFRHRYLKLGLASVDYKSPSLYKGEKIIVRKTGTGINATYDNSDFYVIQVIYIFKPKDRKKVNIKYILGILNSNLLSFYYFSKFGERTKKAFPHLRQENLLSLPIHEVKVSDPSEKAMHDQLVKYADIMLKRNKEKNELTMIFAQVLGNHTCQLRSLGRGYYEVAEYIEKIDKKASTIANEEKEISKIYLKEKGKTLFFSIFADDKWEEALRLTVKDESLRLFIFYSIRKYLEENKRRKKWTTKSLTKVLDVILGRIEVPIFKTKVNIYNAEHNLKMINLLIKEFKSKFKKKFSKGKIHLSQIEEEIQDTDNSIDALVFKLYGLNKNEVVTVLDSMEIDKAVKGNIIRKFKSL